MRADNEFRNARQKKCYQRYQKANAIITDLKFESDYVGIFDFSLLVTYTNQEGIEQQGLFQQYFRHDAIPKKGDSLVIYYKPENDIISEEFYLDQFSDIL